MFGEEFWKKCCVVFTRIPMDKKSIKKRLKSGDGMSDELRAESYIKVVMKFQFGQNIDPCNQNYPGKQTSSSHRYEDELYKVFPGGGGGQGRSPLHERSFVQIPP